MKLFVDTGSIKDIEAIAALGILDGVTYIQRINTVGGIRPAPGTVVGEEARIPYTTEYYFYKLAN